MVSAASAESVVVTDVEHRYGPVTALAGVSFALGSGVTGLLGPNGAGKTTLLRSLGTLHAPDRGRIDVFGLDPTREPGRTEVRRLLGYLPQEAGFYRHFTVRAFVDYAAVLKEIVDRRARRDEVARVLDAVDLGDRAGTRVKNLSGGMQRRLALAVALLGSPRLLVLDEPTTGLDPEQRFRFRDLVSRLGENAVVLLSTHQTEDVSALCERVLVLDRGRLLFEGTPGDLAAVAAGRVRLAAEPPRPPEIGWRTPDGRWRVVGPHEVSGADPADPTIEDGYLLLTGAVTTTAGASR